MASLLPTQTLGLVGAFARDGVGSVIQRIYFEAGDAEFVAHEGGGGGEVAPQARLAGALRGDGALQDAVAHEDGPAAVGWPRTVAPRMACASTRLWTALPSIISG